MCVCIVYPPTTLGGGFLLSLLIAERQAGKLEIPIFIVFGLTQPGIEPKFTIRTSNFYFSLLNRIKRGLTAISVGLYEVRRIV